jgi:MYXO-CTERM domain-containing protein
LALVSAAGAIFTSGAALASPSFYGVKQDGAGNSSLLLFDIGAGTVTNVASTASFMVDCDFDASGTLWAVRQHFSGPFGENTNRAYTIDTTTGASTPMGEFYPSATFTSLAFRSSNSAFYTVNETGSPQGQLSTANMVAGTTLTVSGAYHGLSHVPVYALAFNPVGGQLYGIWNDGTTSPFGSTDNYKLASFNVATGLATPIGSINGTQDDFLSLRFDSAGNAYTVDADTGGVYSLNLSTGAGTLLFTSSTAQGTRGLAFVPAPGAAALLGLGMLGALRRRR